MTATMTNDSGRIDSPPSLAGKGRVELLRILEPLQHKVPGREAGDHPRGGPDDGVEVRVVPDVWVDRLDHGGEDHRVQAPAGLTKCLIVFSRSEEHTSELQSLTNLVCRLLLEKK